VPVADRLYDAHLHLPVAQDRAQPPQNPAKYGNSKYLGVTPLERILDDFQTKEIKVVE
jgi:hypothetical protein